MTILLCTLGMTWAVVPETYALLAPECCPLYAHAPQASTRLREELACSPPDELWIVTTSGTRDLDLLQRWWAGLGSPGRLRIWRTASTDGAAQHEVELIRELTLRAALHAGPGAVLSLSGGRKTMSADLQRAGMVLGCAAMLHVLPPDPDGATKAWADQLRALALDPLAMTRPLPAEVAALIQPVLVGRGQRSDLLDLEPALSPSRFPLPDEAMPFSGPNSSAGIEAWLFKVLDERERDGGRLLANFHAEVAQGDPHETWRSLSRLPPAVIQRLRTERLGPQHRDWLIRLPKADLHCHVGGILTLAEQRAIGATVGQAGGCTPEQREVVTRLARPLDELERDLYGPTEPRVALISRHPKGFRAYESPGDLMGSAILSHPAATIPYATAILDRCRRDGLAYLELRGSPHKYCPDFLDRFAEVLGQGGPDQPVIRFVWIADRRDQEARISSIVRAALEARRRLGGFVVGLDLAGDEGNGDPAELAPAFAEAFRECLPITIHAGEGQPADNIWTSAYHLHADRIGHGLTLADDRNLANRFRERRICLELCPTSNIEVVGFHDPANPDTTGYPSYPWPALWRELGLPLTICTDNPGISRTTLADEYLALARMVPDGISRWEVLSLVRQGFLHAFLTVSERASLLKRIDVEIGIHADSQERSEGPRAPSCEPTHGLSV